MLNKLIYLIAIAAVLFTACDPIEDRDVMSGAITADDLDISAVPQIIDGKNSNFIDLNSDGVGCLTSWNYGNGVTTETKTTVQMVLDGTQDIVFTGLNGDGSQITKTITIQIDTLIDVPEEWALLCGTGEKSWVWDDTDGQAVWGNGGYLGCTSPCWYTVPVGDMDAQAAGEGLNSELVFSVSGSSLTKVYSDGSSETGTFTFDMSKTTSYEGGGLWAKGKLTTQNITVLAGFQSNFGGAPIYEYDILRLDEDKLYLGWPEPGVGAWGAAWFWMFKKK
nr:hypothetical protein [uncultured Draconibacterium sp.]